MEAYQAYLLNSEEPVSQLAYEDPWELIYILQEEENKGKSATSKK